MTTFRPVTPADERFVVSGWSSSYRMSRDLAFVQMDRYAEMMHPIIRAVIARPRTRVIVAEGAVLHGFVCFEPSAIGGVPLVHYLYVALPYRRRRIGHRLLAAADIDPDAPFEYACRTKMSWELRAKIPHARYNPLRARFANEEPNQ